MRKKYSIFLAILFVFLCSPVIALADTEIIMPEYTEKYKKWLELSDEEKQNYIQPQMYKSVDNQMQLLSMDSKPNVATSSLPSRYVRDYYGEVKNQGSSNACWAYSAASVFDTNYYIVNGTKKTFSNMHMDYITASNYNPNGFYRKQNSGGNMFIALAYAMNGMGIALEEDMPKSNITPSTVQAVPNDSKVSDYVKLYDTNEVKDYIYHYGAVSSYTYISSDKKYFSESWPYNQYNLAYYCPDDVTPNHAITIVGWDDNYTNPAFPGKIGAYIVLNSYGSGFGSNGLYHIFYDDTLVNPNREDGEYLFGVTKTEDIQYDYIYQYDEYGCNAESEFVTSTGNLYVANVFNKKDLNSEEKLTEVSVYVPVEGEVTIYINANSNDKNIAHATKTINTYISQPGYHTIKLDTPLTLTGSQFAIIMSCPECCIGAEVRDSSYCYTATSNKGESFASVDGKNFWDLYNNIPMNVCIKAFTEIDSSSQYYQINVSQNITEAGNVTQSKKIRAGKNITVSANVNNGYQFIGWYNGSQSLSKDLQYTFKPTENLNLVAKFEYVGDLENYMFDYKYYADHNLDLFTAYGYNQILLRNHWNNYGKAEGRKASPIFDARYYIANNEDVRKAFGNDYVAVYNHFINYGYNELRNSSLEYSGAYYQSKNADLKSMTAMELIRHYSNYGKNEFRIANTNYDIVSFLFDSSIYAEFNPDVVSVLGNNYDRLKAHWYNCGISEGRIASLVFDVRSYLKINKDVANAYSATNYKAAYDHFVNYGFAEGRQGNNIFSAKYYLEKNADIKNAYYTNYLRALNQFVLYGKNEPRATSPTFNVSIYRQKNIDLKNAYKENYAMYFKHYLKYGQYENRICK